jgi:hypothetical protein
MALLQVISSTTSLFVNLFYTSGAVADSGVLTVIHAITHPLVNYANEMLWETFGAATRPLPPLDFPTAGIAAPGIQSLPVDAAKTWAAS